LALFVHITLRNSDRPDGFKNQVIFFLDIVWNEPVRDAAWNHDVIFSSVSLFTENGLECAATLEYEDDLVGAAVAIILKFVVSLFRARTIRDHVLVKQNRNAASIEISSARNVRRFEMMMLQWAIGRFLQLFAFEKLHFANTRG